MNSQLTITNHKKFDVAVNLEFNSPLKVLTNVKADKVRLTSVLFSCAWMFQELCPKLSSILCHVSLKRLTWNQCEGEMF